MTLRSYYVSTSIYVVRLAPCRLSQSSIRFVSAVLMYLVQQQENEQNTYRKLQYKKKYRGSCIEVSVKRITLPNKEIQKGLQQKCDH